MIAGEIWGSHAGVDKPSGEKASGPQGREEEGILGNKKMTAAGGGGARL